MAERLKSLLHITNTFMLELQTGVLCERGLYDIFHNMTLFTLKVNTTPLTMKVLSYGVEKHTETSAFEEIFR